MLHIRQSNNLNILANQLTGTLDKTLPVDPLTAVTVLVPNRDTARWLSMEIAEQSGITANMDYRLPSEWVWDRIRSLEPNLPEVLPSDREPMRWSLFSLLKQEGILKQFDVLNNYLLQKRDDKSIDSFRWQLAGQLAEVFDQYLVYRPEMLMQWEKRNYRSKEEEWQGELWNILVEKWNLLDHTLNRQHRGNYFNRLIKAVESDEIGVKVPIHLFNPGLMAKPFLQLIDTLQEKSDVYLYLIQPSKTSKSGEVRQADSSELLESLGMESKVINDLLSVWFPEEKANWESSFLDPTEQGTNLARVQDSIMEDKPFPEFKKGDDSINVRSCHSPLREVETLHQFLLDLFSNRPNYKNLTPDDVLVVTPDLTVYEPFIKSVFGTSEEGIPSVPFHIPFSSREENSGYSHAFRHLLQLPESRFAYEDLIGFVQLSVIRRKFQFSDLDISFIKKWADDNRVLWGLDAEHRTAFQQPPEKLQTWSAAMERGWKGQLAGGEAGEMYGQTLLYHAVQSEDEKKLWARFQHLLNLLTNVKNQTMQLKRADEWCERLIQWISWFLPDDNPKHLKVLMDLIKGLRQQVDTAGFDDKIPYQLIRTLMLSGLDNHQVGSAFFTRGVVFSSMVPVKSIPFRVIALLGLNDNRFPRRPVKPAFDIMAQHPQKGERNRPHEDRNLFLETIMAASDIHYCSFVGRDQNDDEPIPPSPILKEWMDLLEKNHPGNFFNEERLNGFSGEYFRQGTGISNVYYQVASSLQEGRGFRGMRIDSPIEYSIGHNSLSVRELEKFFKNPVRHFMKERLGISLEDQDRPKVEFTSEILDRHVLFKHLFGWKLQGIEDRKIEHMLHQSGHLPSGWPGKQTFDELSDSVQVALNDINKQYGEISISDYDIDMVIANHRIKGTIQSYIPGRFLDVFPSKSSGTYLLLSWLRHLLISANYPQRKEKDTIMLYGLREGKQVWQKFRGVDDPEKHLEGFLELYKSGMQHPLPLFPKTAWVYIKHLNEGDRKKAENKSLTEWGGYFNKFPERADKYIELWLGREAELDGPGWEDFEQLSSRVFEPLRNHLEEL